MPNLADRCAENLDGSYTATIGTVIGLAGAVVSPQGRRTYAEAYGTVTNDVLTQVPISISQGPHWQNGYATYTHNTNTLTVDTITGSSDGGNPVLFTAAASVTVTNLASAPTLKTEFADLFDVSNTPFGQTIFDPGAIAVTCVFANLHLGSNSGFPGLRAINTVEIQSDNYRGSYGVQLPTTTSLAHAPTTYSSIMPLYYPGQTDGLQTFDGTINMHRRDLTNHEWHVSIQTRADDGGIYRSEYFAILASELRGLYITKLNNTIFQTGSFSTRIDRI